MVTSIAKKQRTKQDSKANFILHLAYQDQWTTIKKSKHLSLSLSLALALSLSKRFDVGLLKRLRFCRDLSLYRQDSLSLTTGCYQLIF